MEKNCVFCKIIAGQIKADIVYEDSQMLAFNDISPQAPVHIILIPKKHIDRISDLKQSHSRLAGDLILAANQLAKNKNIANSGYRIIINCNGDAGQAVFHLHLHLMGGRTMSWPPG